MKQGNLYYKGISFLLALILFCGHANADHILNFNSKITVNTDGSLLVVETIKVFNGTEENGRGNDEINRGIFKTFPTKYRNKQGLYENVTFDVESVTKNGSDEPYFTKDHANGIVLYIGDKDVYLDEGVYTYAITYKTQNQLGLFAGHDELYYNAIGTDWSFYIDSASCEVILPSGARINKVACYTGEQGSKEQDCNGKQIGNNKAQFGNPGLNPNEGFTIAVSWQKGIIAEPQGFAKFKRLIISNWGLLLMIFGAIGAFLVNLYLWFKVGKDPKKGIVYPQFEPPKDMSPAGTGYVLEQKFTNTLIAATIVDWAVNNHISIEVGKEGLIFKDQTYTIRPSAGTPKNPGYEDLHERASLLMNQTIGKNKYLPSLASLKTSVQNHVEANYIDNGKLGQKRGFFSFNIGALIPGYLIAIGSTIGAIIFVVNNPSTTIVAAIAVAIVLCFISQVFFTIVMKAYNVEGRKMADYIEGFKMYLTTAEGLRFDKLNPPEKTLELYEKYLPFAIALGVENRWAAQFETQMAKAIADNTYHPTWYVGHPGMFMMGSGFSAGSFASGLSDNLSSNISSSMTPPGSSGSGGFGGGGGFSGGGGGGGGGGGW
jgi:uncharacterized membrane protein